MRKQNMKNLADILAMKKQIIALVKQFGYSDEIKLYRDTSILSKKGPLQFVVKIMEEHPLSYKVPSYLQAKLANMLDCEVEVIVYQNIKKLYRYDTDQKSALITDEKALTELFGNTEISFSKIEGKMGLLLQNILLRHAEEYLQKKLEIPAMETKRSRAVAVHQKNRTYAFIGRPPAPKSNGEGKHEKKKAKLTIDKSNHDKLNNVGSTKISIKQKTC